MNDNNDNVLNDCRLDLSEAELSFITTYKLLSPDHKALAFAYVNRLEIAQAIAGVNPPENGTLAFILPQSEAMYRLSGLKPSVPENTLLLLVSGQFDKAQVFEITDTGVKELASSEDPDRIMELRESAMAALDAIPVAEAETLSGKYVTALAETPAIAGLWE